MIRVKKIDNIDIEILLQPNDITLGTMKNLHISENDARVIQDYDSLLRHEGP